MSENSFQAGNFLVCFPVWTFGIFDPGIRALLEARHRDGDRAVTLFTDEHQAVAFAQQRGAPAEFVLKAFADPFALLGLLDVLEQKGITHVVFDPTAGTKAVSFPLPGLRQHIIGWLA